MCWVRRGGPLLKLKLKKMCNISGFTDFKQTRTGLTDHVLLEAMITLGAGVLGC